MVDKSSMNVRFLGPDANGNNAYRAVWGQGFGNAATFVQKEDQLIFKGGDPENPVTAEAGKTIGNMVGVNNIFFPKDSGPKFIADGGSASIFGN